MDFYLLLAIFQTFRETFWRVFLKDIYFNGTPRHLMKSYDNIMGLVVRTIMKPNEI